MESKKLNTLFVALIIGNCIVIFFGELLAIAFWDLLYRPEFKTPDNSYYLFSGLESVSALIIPTCYAVLLYRSSKHVGSSPLLWAALGFITSSPLVIVVFILFNLTNGVNGSNEPTEVILKKFITWSIAIILVGIMIGILRNLLPMLGERILTDEMHQQYFMTTRFDKFLRTGYKFIVNVGVAIWISKELKKQNHSPILWIVLSLMGGLLAPIIFYSFILLTNKFTRKYST